MDRHRVPTRCVIGGLLFLALSCAGPPAGSEGAETIGAAEIPEAPLERARSAVRSMGSRLMSTLVEELGDGGPVRAVRVCAELAPEIAREQSSEDLSIRRVSLRVRNPADAPDDYERGVLESWAALLAAGTLPDESAELETVDGRARLRYMRPIKVMTPCLTCHGDRAAMSEDLRTVLDERYPDDQAVGYRDGDLRGAFTVIIDLPPDP